MKLRITSDLHTEFWRGQTNLIKEVLPHMEDEREQVLLLAGDIDTAQRPFRALKRGRFAGICEIKGNHEWYDARQIPMPDVRVWEIGDVTIIGATLWSSLKGLDPIAVEGARRMNDFKFIHGLNPEYMNYLFQREFFMLREALSNNRHRKVVVMTHHAPSEKSIAEKYLNDPATFAYWTDLSDLMIGFKPALWIHGHTHNSSDYMIGETRVISNPLGYYFVDKNPEYNPKLVVEI